LWGVGPHGWCDCGQPATRSVRLHIGCIGKHGNVRGPGSAATYALCEECYRLETSL
jgi:hypothetical protein